ncbi:MAG: RNA polymerase II-associated protein [Proteobacteria bacterium]|nr:RNA polymerase II-associated protein [Desulfobulbaceae bacterium]MBU4152389.1 RNA polymerase II-associated protein [Pseudomonadota bacterium]MDP2106417.1 RNA polymerase II-associated protein [Desulfobulbaceae bacterium]
MDLVCDKYKQTLEADDAYCRHPTEYCKFRTACLINFVSKENKAKAAMVAVVPEKSSEQEV